MRLINAIIMGWQVFKIRLLGTYKVSIWDGTTDYAVYEMGGRTFYIPSHDAFKVEEQADD